MSATMHAPAAAPSIVTRAAELARTGASGGAGATALATDPHAANHFSRACARAAAWLDGSADPVSDGAPAWIDDLGLRRSESPAVALAAAAPPEWTSPNPASAAELEAVASAISADPRRLASLLALLVDDLGAWDDAIVLARAVDPAAAAKWPRHSDASLAASRIGTLLGMDADPSCRTWFAVAAALAPTPADAALAAMRTAVADVKRLAADVEAVDESMARAHDAADAIAHEGEQRAVRALLRNLQALRHVRAKQRSDAAREVAAAWELVAGDDVDAPALGAQFVDEVRTQVLSNLAVVTGMTEGWAAAVPLFERGVAIAATSPSAALQMETGCLLGLARFHAGDLEGARTALLRADAAGAAASAPLQRAQVHKLLALIAHDLGDIDAAGRWIGQAVAVGGLA